MIDLSPLEQVLATTQEVVAEALDEQKKAQRSDLLQSVVRSGVIKHFEFSYELCWKALQRWLKENLSANEVEGISRRQLYRLAAEQRLIDDVDQWMLYHRARNLTSHTYNQATADEVFNIALEFLGPAKELLARLKARNE